jgi:hypothetical protein
MFIERGIIVGIRKARRALAVYLGILHSLIGRGLCSLRDVIGQSIMLVKSATV